MSEMFIYNFFLEIVEKKIPSLFNLDFSGENIDKSNPDLRNFIDILKIIKTNKQDFPYLLVLDFKPNSNQLKNVSLIQDPHYQKKDLPKTFVGHLISLPDMVQIENNPESLFKNIKMIREHTTKKYYRNLYLMNSKISRKVLNETNRLAKTIIQGNMSRFKLIHPNRVCIGGNSNSILVVGNMRKDLGLLKISPQN